jgi:hypothetical protein
MFLNINVIFGKKIYFYVNLYHFLCKFTFLDQFRVSAPHISF